MLRALLAACLVTAVLAGCAEAPASDSALEAPALDVTASTGGIRGIVVDEAIRPIAGAQVTVTGADAERSATTDETGLFTFSGLPPGTYFVKASSGQHREAQTSTDVAAGVADPPIVRIQLERLFTQDPYTVQVVREGFFECSQANAGLYASSNCIYDPYRWALGPPSPTQPIDNVTQQEREWHSDVSAGWQQLVFEMQWEPTSQGTSAAMGIVVSTFKPERSGGHWFAEFEGPSPIRGQLDVGEEHATASGEDPQEIPAEGLANLSYFVAVRSPPDATCQVFCVPPGLAVNQQFTLYLTMFHYGVPPEGWSLVNGDRPPF